MNTGYYWKMTVMFLPSSFPHLRMRISRKWGDLSYQAKHWGGRWMVLFLHLFGRKRIHANHYVSNEKSVGTKENLRHSFHCVCTWNKAYWAAGHLPQYAYNNVLQFLKPRNPNILLFLRIQHQYWNLPFPHKKKEFQLDEERNLCVLFMVSPPVPSTVPGS